jgi:hypothetical protein
VQECEPLSSGKNRMSVANVTRRSMSFVDKLQETGPASGGKGGAGGGGGGGGSGGGAAGPGGAGGQGRRRAGAGAFTRPLVGST